MLLDPAGPSLAVLTAGALLIHCQAISGRRWYAQT